MKFSVNWLREFVELPATVNDLAHLLTMAGVEIEGIENRGAEIDHVVVAQINDSKPHPNADRLSVCVVNDGTNPARPIVCGAKNYHVGDKVLLALPGAKLPNGLEIKKSKLRGVESDGMLCSAIELGLGEESSGILILSPEAKIGAPMRELFPATTILDVEITPNRGDLLSHYGLAREIAALTGKKITAALPPGTAASTEEGVRISAARECAFFSLRRIENIKVGPSPDWLRAKLESVGVRAINNVVDISNLVMLELGQPTHAFDADKIRGQIEVRLARAGEKLLALDGKTYSLMPENLVIADAARAVGLAGVMGGEETGVSQSTRNVLLESAYFLPASIRRTARTLNLPSDASYRFERGVDPEMILRASQRVTDLIGEIAGGTPASEISVAGKLPANPAEISLAYEKCDRVLGVSVAPSRVDEILTGFGLSKNKKTAWSIPSYRRDLQRDVDLIEEVVRAHGVQNIPGSDRSRFTPSSEADRDYNLETGLRHRLVAHGLSEARTSKLIPRTAPAFTENAIALRNPLSEDHVALRPGLISGLLEVLGRNTRAGAERVAIFELGRAFIPPSATEERHLAILLWGNLSAGPDWRSPRSRRLDLFDLKGALASVVPELSLRPATMPEFALAAEVWSGDRRVGFAGQVSAVKAGATGAVLVAAVHADLLFARGDAATKFRELERFPAVTRDIAMIVPEKISHAEILRTIETPREPLLESVALFDLFSGGEVGEGRKSLAYSLTYRDKTRTLTSDEVSAAHARIRERLKAEIRAELRE